MGSHTAGYEGKLWPNNQGWLHLQGYLAHKKTPPLRTLQEGLSDTLSVEPPLCPYGNTYRRSYGLFNSELFTKSLSSPLRGALKPSTRE